MGVFLSSLKEELKTDVRIHKPRSVYNDISLDLEFEAKIAPTRGPKGGNWAPSARAMTQSTLPTRDFAQPSSGIPETSRPAAMPQTMPNPSTALPPWDAERQSRREKGLCFHCNERFSSGHRCKTTLQNHVCLFDGTH